jgi:hypothetical protein
LDLSLTIPGPMAVRKCRGAIVLIEELFNQDRETLRAELGKLGCELAADLSSIVLVGGKGTRLAESRKLIDPADYPQLDSSYYGQIGPKGMAIIEGVLGGESVRRPLTNWHLEIHAPCPEVVETSQRLERGELDYKEHEAVVKYETAYQIFAGRGRMFGVYDPGSYWADLGTEAKIVAAEEAFPKSRIFG